MTFSSIFVKPFGVNIAFINTGPLNNISWYITNISIDNATAWINIWANFRPKLDPKKQKMNFFKVFVKLIEENTAFISTRPLN